MTTQHVADNSNKAELMRKFLKRIVNDDKRAKQLFRLYFDRKEISEEQFYKSISRY